MAGKSARPRLVDLHTATSRAVLNRVFGVNQEDMTGDETQVVQRESIDDQIAGFSVIPTDPSGSDSIRALRMGERFRSLFHNPEKPRDAVKIAPDHSGLPASCRSLDHPNWQGPFRFDSPGRGHPTGPPSTSPL